MIACPVPITYQLHIKLLEPLELQVGALGYFSLPPGQYIYTGRARRAMTKRILRHLRYHKPLRWHIDYLLRSPAAVVTRVSLHDEPECLVNQRLNGCHPIPGFGSSDCQNNCVAHLTLIKL